MSPTGTIETVATEEDFEPTGAGGNVLPLVIDTPAFDEAYSNAMCVDWSELDATYRRWPFDGFVNSKIERKMLINPLGENASNLL